MLPELLVTIEKMRARPVADERKKALQPLIGYLKNKVDQGQGIKLNFICTHNSRRSQFAQIWAQTAADFFGIPATCSSGGVEVTAFNERAVAAILRSGFKVVDPGGPNPVYSVFHSGDGAPIQAFSKLFDDPVNRKGPFAAIMTCSDADEHCPYIPGAEIRIPLHYEDPKAFDGTPEETAGYDERSIQIGAEMFYVFDL